MDLTQEQKDLLNAVCSNPGSEAAFSGMIANQLNEAVVATNDAVITTEIKTMIVDTLIDRALFCRLRMRELARS